MLGLWRGCWPNVCRAALVNLGDLSTYDSVKRNILDNTNLEDNTLTHTMSSACAGSVSLSVITTITPHTYYLQVGWSHHGDSGRCCEGEDNESTYR